MRHTARKVTMCPKMTNSGSFSISTTVTEINSLRQWDSCVHYNAWHANKTDPVPMSLICYADSKLVNLTHSQCPIQHCYIAVQLYTIMTAHHSLAKCNIVSPSINCGVNSF